MQKSQAKVQQDKEAFAREIRKQQLQQLDTSFEYALYTFNFDRVPKNAYAQYRSWLLMIHQQYAGEGVKKIEAMKKILSAHFSEATGLDPEESVRRNQPVPGKSFFDGNHAYKIGQTWISQHESDIKLSPGGSPRETAKAFQDSGTELMNLSLAKFCIDNPDATPNDVVRFLEYTLENTKKIKIQELMNSSRSLSSVADDMVSAWDSQINESRKFIDNTRESPRETDENLRKLEKPPIVSVKNPAYARTMDFVDAQKIENPDLKQRLKQLADALFREYPDIDDPKARRFIQAAYRILPDEEMWKNRSSADLIETVLDEIERENGEPQK